MTFIGKLFTATVAALYGLIVVALPTDPTPTPTIASTVYTATSNAHNAPTATNPPTPTTTTPFPPAGSCDAYVAIAAHVGWPLAALDTLRLAMSLESGCNPQAVGDSGDSIGLLQVHCPSWATPNKYWPIGWMQHYGFGNCQDLFNPITNLKVGLAIWEGWTGSTPGWHHWKALP